MRWPGHRRAMRWAFEDTIGEAEAHLRDQYERHVDADFARGYLMGLRVGAAMAGLPRDVWASLERYQRQNKEH